MLEPARNSGILRERKKKSNFVNSISVRMDGIRGGGVVGVLLGVLASFC